MHIPGLRQFTEDESRRSDLGQREVPSQPPHPGDQGRIGGRRVLPGHREQEVSEGTES